MICPAGQLPAMAGQVMPAKQGDGNKEYLSRSGSVAVFFILGGMGLFDFKIAQGPDHHFENKILALSIEFEGS